jgi:hypothetical protein
MKISEPDDTYISPLVEEYIPDGTFEEKRDLTRGLEQFFVMNYQSFYPDDLQRHLNAERAFPFKPKNMPMTAIPTAHKDCVDCKFLQGWRK